MGFERRLSPRIDHGFDVEIRYRDRRAFIAYAQNLSQSGIYLRTGSLSIPGGTLVDLQFTLDGELWQMAALVVRRDGEGIGLLFRIPQPELYARLARVVRQRPRSEARLLLQRADRHPGDARL